ncbi:MAG: hypothetical protein DMG82_04640 [Acidobacteria bacterium]|nr:MAG: hypothetical protein DMG82_04640 [Acidobacteriota bacterium]
MKLLESFFYFIDRKELRYGNRMHPFRPSEFTVGNYNSSKHRKSPLLLRIVEISKMHEDFPTVELTFDTQLSTLDSEGKESHAPKANSPDASRQE